VVRLKFSGPHTEPVESFTFKVTTEWVGIIYVTEQGRGTDWPVAQSRIVVNNC